jgi:formylglycine-generating enzyme required for sulfatase activity
MSCPDGMVPIEGAFCIDRWEASRPDATLTAPGADGSRATSRPHVMPWIAVDPAEMNTERAAAARAAAGKRLCAPQEWRVVCRGPLDTTYSYGDAYDPVACNGLDTFCRCEGPPYPGCHGECGASVHAVATGTFPECASAWGVFDLNGNAWELVASEDGLDHYRGGAYNCLDPARLHDCDYEATWNPSAKGFRCCADGERAR